MNILVTGSNGFIGSHTSNYLRSHGNTVIGLGRRQNSETVTDDYICCDLGKDDCKDILLGYKKKIDAVIHMASDMRREPNNIDVVLNNCGGTQKLLEFCEEADIHSFVELSSLPVIGAPVQHPVTEDHPLCPPTVYHATKISQEYLCDYAYRKHNINTCSLRICAPVGIGMNEKTIFAVFVKNAVQNLPLVLSGKGTRKQTYIHVSDIAAATELAVISKVHGIYNLASKNLISNYDLAKLIVEVTGSKSEIIFNGEYDSCDNDIWDVDISKLHNATGFEPVVFLKDAILEMADYFRRKV